MFQGYRRKQELKKRNLKDKYQEKNKITRNMIEQLSQMTNCPDLFLIDSYFMIKENVKLL